MRAVRQGDPPGQHGAGDGPPVRAEGRRARPDHRQQQARHQPSAHGDLVYSDRGVTCHVACHV